MFDCLDDVQALWLYNRYNICRGAKGAKFAKLNKLERFFYEPNVETPAE